MTNTSNMTDEERADYLKGRESAKFYVNTTRRIYVRYIGEERASADAYAKDSRSDWAYHNGRADGFEEAISGWKETK